MKNLNTVTRYVAATIALVGISIAMPASAQSRGICDSGSSVPASGLGVAMNDLVTNCITPIRNTVKRDPAIVAMDFQKSANLNMKAHSRLTQFLAASAEAADNAASLLGFPKGVSWMAEAVSLFLSSESYEQFAARIVSSKLGDRLIKDLAGPKQTTKDEVLKKLYEALNASLDPDTFAIVTYDSPSEKYGDDKCGPHSGSFAVRVDPKSRRVRVQSHGVCDCNAESPVLLHRGLIEGRVDIGKDKAGDPTYQFVGEFMTFSGLKCPGTGGVFPDALTWGRRYSSEPDYSLSGADWTKPSARTVERLKVSRSERGSWGEESEPALKNAAIGEMDAAMKRALEAFPSGEFELQQGFEARKTEAQKVDPKKTLE